MNTKIKKIALLSLTLSLISSNFIPAFAYDSISETNYQIKQNVKSESNLPEYPDIKDSLNYKTSRIGKEIIHYVDGLNFENYDESGGNPLGLRNYMLSIDIWEAYDKAARFEKLVVPWTQIENKLKDDTYEELYGVRITLVGFDGSFKFTLEKDFDYDINSSKEDIVFTRKEIDEELIRRGVDPETAEMPHTFSLYFTSLDKNKKELYYAGTTKFEMERPLEYHYTAIDNPTYENWGIHRLQGDLSWYTKDTNDRTTLSLKTKDLYYETSTLEITPNKAENIKPGESINLNLDLKNTSKNIPNSFLVMGYDILDEQGNKIGNQEIKTTSDNKNINLKQGESLQQQIEYKIPDDYKGKKISFKPYVYTAYAVMNKDGTNKEFYYNPQDKEYDKIVDIFLDNDSTGGDGEGGNTGGSENGNNSGNGTESKKSIILASGNKYTDVLTATVLGNEKNSPILLSSKDLVSKNTLNEIKRLSADEVIISGGPDSVSEEVVKQLEKEGYKVRRIYGQDRYETAKKIGEEVRLSTNNKTDAILVDGTNFPDVITLSTIANEKRAPIILTNPSKLNSTTNKALKDWNIKNVTIGGENNSVSNEIENELKTTLTSVERIGGADRYETAYKVAEKFRNITNNKTNMILVDGTNFPDGITISSVASKFKAPILLTTPTNLNKTTENAVNNWTIENILIGGGYNSVSKTIEDSLKIKNKERVSGDDRYDTAVKISQKYSEEKFSK
ncbi:cell wall-binding repeat-containing protein [Peptostreptococcus faecalis]|uniref:cell wall-binding repeat-containing protein n=1 Tax=Peptostreptococcus faecalis TaxID=2045015 RepID=UPI0015E10C56|nr:cell wall-binding repeat-containing protein [Peptostreptococcus faecalis]